LDTKNPDKAAKVTGALEVSQGRAVIAANGTVTSGTETTQVTLPRRGMLRVCASTTVNLGADSSVPPGEVPGLMMSMDHGAVEASFATGRNSDILLTPDFRILIGGPGSAEVRVRLGQHGDTCVENAGVNAPYVLVTSVFDSGSYRVQPGQRVMFQHGNVHEVVDQEKEPCGCPPAAPKGNEFPLAQSEGLAATPAPAPSVVKPGSDTAPPVEPLVYSSPIQAPTPAVEAKPAPVTAADPPTQAKTATKKSGFFRSVGRFFRRIFGAES
jgi:predicted component of type VI protein secretion system